ncbi:piggyBac transposable element-derived protein 4-like [Schistocerca americana]|uniref:piggyBac transposable element-derived protein 4-like n=1 Tax=Schistocerca americana TaxID=7009 RepID=UPI001F4F2DBA|nr:piggyBac transposable element-derived protein 4-like [Schistocerca americana]
MGIHQLPEAASYWSSDPYVNVNAVSNVMTLGCYKKIIENLHCNDNLFQPATNDPGYDKLYKIRPLISALNKNCLKVYHPSTSLAVDESMVAFKGRTSLKQYMLMKPAKRGYKIWCLADANTGFISNFDVYTGKSVASRQEFKDCQMCEKVVLELCKPFFNSNRNAIFDNFFSTFRLMKELRKRGLYSCGTVRGNRKGLPPFLASKSPSLNHGEFTFAVKSGVAAVKWHDSKAVCLISTAHNPKDVVFIKRKLKDGSTISISCPEVVHAYNSTTGGVDRFDQLQERYMVGRQSVKWWHRLFIVLLT